MEDMDDLATRRSSDLAGVEEAGERAQQKSKVPSFHRWLAVQRHNRNPEIAAAAEHIQARWPLTVYYRHDRTLSALRTESSEFLVGAQLLVDEYIAAYPDANADFLHEQTGTSVAIYPDGPSSIQRCRNCRRPAFPGAEYCDRHGGTEWLTDDDRIEISRRIADQLTGASDRALRALLELLDSARSEKVRADVAIRILELNGHSATQKFEIVTDGGPSPAQALLERIAQLGKSLPEEDPDDPGEDGARRLALVPAPRDDDEDDEIVDAEIIEPEPTP